MAALVHKAAMGNGGHDEGETFYDTTAEDHGHEASAWGNSDDTGEWVPKTRKPSGRPELKPTRRSSRVPGEWVDDTQVDEDSQEDEGDERHESDEAEGFADVDDADNGGQKQDLGFDQELHQHERAGGARPVAEAARPTRSKSSTPAARSVTETTTTRKSKSPPGPSRTSGSGSDASLLDMRATPQRLDGEAFLSDDSLEEPGSTVMHGVSPVRRALEGKSATPSGAGTDGGGGGGGVRRTDSGGVREQQSLIDKLQRENFELKLRITLLTESFQETSGMSEAELRKRLADELQRYEMLQIDYRLLRENFDKQVAGHERDLDEAQAQLRMLEEDNARLVAELRDLEYERDELARVEEDYYALKSQIDGSRDMRAGSSTAVAAEFPDSPACNSMRSLVQRLNSNNEQLKRRIYEDERESATSSPPFQRGGGDKWGQTIRLLQSLLAQLDYDSDLSPGRRSPASPDGVVLDLVARLEVAVDRFKQRYANLEAQYQNERLQLQRELLATSTDLRDTIKDKNALQALVHDQEDELDRLHEELRLRRTDSPVDGLKAGVELRKAQRELDKYRTVVDELLGFVHEHYDSHADVATLTEYLRDIFKLVGTIEEIRKNFDEMEAQTRQREDALASLTAERDALAADIDKFKARQRADAKNLQDAKEASQQLESEKVDLERSRSKLEAEKAQLAKEKASLEIRAESLQKQVEENGYALAEDLAKATEKLRISERENKELKRRVDAFEQSATGSTERALGDTKAAKRLGDAQRETETLLRDKKLLEDRVKSLEDKLAFETTKSDGLSAKLRSGSGHSRQSSGTGIRSNLEMQKAFQAESYKRLITLQEQVDRLEKDRRDDHETIKFLQAKANKNHNDSYRIVTSFFLKGEKLLSPEEAQKISARLAEIKKHDNGKLPLMEALMMETLDNLVRKHERERREPPQEAPSQDSSSSKSNSKLWAARYQELERRLAKEEALRRAERESYEQRLQQMTQEVLMQRTENQKLK